MVSGLEKVTRCLGVPMKKASILFVCMGNIRRSPATEAVFAKLDEEFQDGRELDILVRSAGTEGFHVGKRPDARMRAARDARGRSRT